MEAITTATVSPVQIFVGGIALGAGIYVGYKSAQGLEMVASKGVNKLREKMAAKKAAKTSAPVAVVEAPVAPVVEAPVAPAPVAVVEAPVAPVVEAPVAPAPVAVVEESVDAAINVLDTALQELENKGVNVEEVRALTQDALLELAGQIGSDIKKQLQPEPTEVAVKLEQAQAFATSKPAGSVVYQNQKKKHHHR